VASPGFVTRRGGAKLESRLWCTHGALQGEGGWLQQLLDDWWFCDYCSTDWKSCELLTSAPADLADYPIFG